MLSNTAETKPSPSATFHDASGSLCTGIIDAASTLFLEGQGWGYGGSVDIEAIEPWNVPGRYGWVGGTGTSAHITPSTGTAAILLTQVAADSPVPPQWMRDFWRYAASVS